MHLRGCAARYDGRPLEHVKFLNEIGKDVRPVAFFGRRPPTSRFPMSTSVSSISGPLRSLARSSHEGHHARPFPCCVFFRPLSLKEGDARCGFVVFGFGLAPVARSPLTEDVRAARGTPAPASRTLAETSGRVGSLGGGSSMRIISRRKRKKKCNGFESAVVSPAAGSEREKEIEIDWVWGWRRRAKIRCAGPVLLLRGSPRSQFSKQTVCLCAS